MIKPQRLKKGDKVAIDCENKTLTLLEPATI